MLKIQEIREIIKLVDQSTIEEFVYEHSDSKIKLKKKGAITAKQATAPQVIVEEVRQPVAESTQPVAAVQETVAPKVADNQQVEKNTATSQDESLHKITSPMVGTFYASSSPDSDPYARVGDRVKKDSVVCIVEAMKLFNEIEAEVNGEIVEVLVENGQLVEYGQPLFLVKAE
ncbi:acetyl-CoA carboxylase biotin carboxyl carrier protein [Metabacillus iocasae]|uniref:Biotin carboxyl carrier protein of acetyl-CoA carboxylase n=1 Tax=Priestia iocasae TaxID=2291674 RepID=A0ABS2QQ55_9BACI|nr:acetyl-CoA carboxylase biotin carboxyl carrier protein [Metabacillus iocasae]MBM7701582.1 acetyl-CoA carboxylase biotin carboxyl carrier protein [Metabacillus iocasae]